MNSENNSDQKFYQQSSDWTYDLYHSQTLWLRRSLFALSLLSILLGISLVTNALLFPLKEKVPYLYAFDHATGEITQVGTLDPTSLSSNWSLARYFLIRYVIQYESYDYDNIDQPYQMVWAQSSDHVQAQYDAVVKSNNPSSPYHLYANNKYITVKVISVNRLNENTADIKFEKTLHDRAANTDQVIQEEAIVKWKFSPAQTMQTMLDRDPLGFKVTYYQVTQIM